MAANLHAIAVIDEQESRECALRTTTTLLAQQLNGGTANVRRPNHY